MIIRTYFDKNNTIIYNNNTNTGKNPVTELYYGGGVINQSYSRFLFYFDENRLKNLISAYGMFFDYKDKANLISRQIYF